MTTIPDDLILEDEIALLRPMQPDDLHLLQPFADHEPDLFRFSLVQPLGPHGMENYVKETLRMRAEGKEYPFVVIDKKSGETAGSTRFYDIQLNNSSTQLGYTWYGKKFQRTRLNRHCKLLMLTYAFETWGMERVEFRADANNERSINAMKNIGCTVEGFLRKHAALAQGRRTSIILSILKEEWENGVKENLMKKMIH